MDPIERKAAVMAICKDLFCSNVIGTDFDDVQVFGDAARLRISIRRHIKSSVDRSYLVAILYEAETSQSPSQEDTTCQT